MMDKNLRNIPMRDELRQIIIPLLQKCMDENPQDLIVFCSRYFQSLLDDRNSSGLSENHESNSSDEHLKARCEEAIEKKSSLQGSSSLPILNEEVAAKGLQLRETSSWNDRSSFCRTPTQPKKMYFSVTEPVIQIGDQLSATERCIEAEVGKSIGEGCKSEVVATSILNADKNDETNIVSGNKEKSTEIIKADMSPYSSNEFENEFDELMNLATVSFYPQTPVSTRKKWKIEPDAHWKLGGKLKLSGRDNADLDDAVGSLTFKEERDEATATLKDMSAENMSLNASFGFIPKLVTDLEKLEIPRNMESGMDVGDIEALVKSVSRALQELIHVLCASRLYFDDKLEKVKQIKGGREEPKVVEKPQIAQRKKRNAETIHVSDVRPQNRKNYRRANKEGYKGLENCVEEMHSLEKDIRMKAEKRSTSTEYLDDRSTHNDNIKRFLKQKTDSNDANQKISVTSGDVKEDIQKEPVKGIRHAKSQIKKKDDASIEAQTKIEKFNEKEKVYIKRSEQYKSKPHPSDASEYKAGRSSEFEFPDESIQHRPWRKRRNSNFNYQDSHPNSQFENRHQLYPKQTRRPNEGKSFNMPHETYPKNRGRGFNNRGSRFRGFRGEHISNRQRSGSSNLLECGDVFQETTSTQRSVGTETDFSQVKGHSKNSNATPNLDKNSSSLNESRTSDNIDGHCIKVPKKNVENDTIHINTLPSLKGNVCGSICQHNESKVSKSINRSPKPIDKPIDLLSKSIDRPNVKPEPKSESPKQTQLKDVPDSAKENVHLESKSVFPLSRPISSSSLNPAAKSFNPTNFMKTKGNINSPVKSQENPIFSGRERYTKETTETVSQSKDSKLSGKKNYRYDWTIESSESDFPSEESGISNNLNALNIENGRSDVINKAVRHGFRSRNYESVQEINIPNPITNGSANRSSNENIFQERMRGALKNPQEQPIKKKNNNKKPCSDLDLKTDEDTYCNEESEHENTSSKQVLGMSSAVGDFMTTDGEIRVQPPLDRQGSVNSPLNFDVQLSLPRSIDVQNESVAGSVPQNSDRSVPKEEPGISSACGDVGPGGDIGARGIVPPLPDRQEVIPSFCDCINPANVANQELRFSFAVDPPNRDVSDSTQGIGNRSADVIEDFELNFACFSENESSESYSDLSEEYSSEENNSKQNL